jgi:aspartyl-tRNA synthetase
VSCRVLICYSRASEKLHFFTLRDSSASVQLVSRSPELSERLMAYPLESVLLVEGVVKARKQKARATGSVSVSTRLSPRTQLSPFSLGGVVVSLKLHLSRQTRSRSSWQTSPC